MNREKRMSYLLWITTPLMLFAIIFYVMQIDHLAAALGIVWAGMVGQEIYTEAKE